MDWSFSNLSELHQKFGWEEYVVLFVTLFISVLIGVYWAYRGQNTTSEFLMASKQMTLFPTTMSLACRYEKVVIFFYYALISKNTLKFHIGYHNFGHTSGNLRFWYAVLDDWVVLPICVGCYSSYLSAGLLQVIIVFFFCFFFILTH